jgi:ABC-2 type transport system ATP-binding protein
MISLVEVDRLSKHFHKQAVVQQLAFQVAKGEILGFLGPNGAGKSTTMKMITGYLRPSKGTVHVGGYDISKHPQQAKKHIGYLSEHNPLYLEMYVHEYLRFMGSIRGLQRKQCLANTREVVDKCGITKMQNKKLRDLSKGYRQRVGLAQALMHKPHVLILDEPTTGLDPNQLHEIRALIKEVSQDKAVILSTHIMQEVEALCDQVLIVDQGKMIAHDTMAQLASQHNGRVVVEFKEPLLEEMLEKINGVQRVQVLSARKYIIDAGRDQDIREALFHFAQEHALTLLGLEQQKSSLEAIFQQLTKASVVAEAD